jgi:hypothetical protein
LDQTYFGRRQELREPAQVVGAGWADPKRSLHIDPDHMATRREPQLALADEQRTPRLVLLTADQGVLPVGAESSVGSGLAVGAGQVVVATGPTVIGPSAGLEMPAPEGPQAFLLP